MTSRAVRNPERESGVRGGRVARLAVFPFTTNVPGGAFVSAAVVIAEITRRADWDVTVVLPHAGVNDEAFRSAGAHVRVLGIPPERVEAVRAKRFRRQLGYHVHIHYQALSLLRRERPQLVHVNDDSALLSWGTAARRLGIPVVWHVRQERRNRLDPLYRRIASSMIFIAESTRQRMPSASADSSVVVHNATDTDAFRPAADRREAKTALGLDPDRLVIGFAGRLRPVKRPEWAVRAGLDLIDRGHDVQVLIVGPDGTEGRYDRELREMVDRSPTPDADIRFLGYRTDMPEIMRALDVFLLPSVAEPFGLVVTEAMASGAAVIATNAGGVREILDDGRTGILVPADDYASFVHAAERVVLDDGLRASLARAGLREVRERFSPEREADGVLAAYESLL